MKNKYKRALSWANFYKLIPKDQLWQLWKQKNTVSVMVRQAKPVQKEQKIIKLGSFLQNFVKNGLKVAKIK